MESVVYGEPRAYGYLADAGVDTMSVFDFLLDESALAGMEPESAALNAAAL